MFNLAEQQCLSYHRDMDTAFPFKPFLLFDVTIGQEKSNDGG